MVKESNLKNVVQISPDQIGKMVRTAIKHKMVPWIMGAPGIGKTSAIRAECIAMAKEMWPERTEITFAPKPNDWLNPNMVCVPTVMLSQLEETDMRGIPINVVGADGVTRTYYVPSELWPENGVGFVILDEAANANTRVMNAAQEMLLDHKAGGVMISPNVYFILASNRPDDNAGTSFIPYPLRNRVMWFEVSKPTIEDWLATMERVGQPINPVMTAWLMSIGSKYFNTFNPQAEQYAFGTARSIHAASRVIEGEDDPEMIRLLVGSLIGEDAGTELVKFMQLTKTVDVNAIIKNPKEIHQYENDLGLLYSISLTLIDRFIDSAATNEPILEVILETKRKEHGMFILKSLMNKLGRAQFVVKLTKCKNSKEIMNKYYQLLAASNAGDN